MKQKATLLSCNVGFLISALHKSYPMSSEDIHRGKHTEDQQQSREDSHHEDLCVVRLLRLPVGFRWKTHMVSLCWNAATPGWQRLTYRFPIWWEDISDQRACCSWCHQVLTEGIFQCRILKLVVFKNRMCSTLSGWESAFWFHANCVLA